MSEKRLYTCLVILICCALMARAEGHRIFRAITASDGLADNSAQTLKCTKTGRMTITTIGNINFYDGANFSHINTEQEEKYQLQNYKGHYHLYYDAYHHLWLKGSHNVVCVDLNTEKSVTNMDSLFASMGMKEKVYDMFVDDSNTGDVWLCGKDYVQDNKLHKRFPVSTKLNLQDLMVDKAKNLYLFYDDGSLVCFDIASGKQRFQNRAYEGEAVEKYSRSSVIKPYKKGLFQIRNGEKGAILLHYDLAARKWSTVMESEFHLNNMAIHEEVLYIASEWGYFTYNMNTREIVHEKVLTLSGGRALETDVNAVEFDLQGGMWIGTEKRGLLYGHPLNAPFTSLRWDNPETTKYYALMDGLQGIKEFNGKKANVLFIDSRRWTWVGTSLGLYLYKSPQAEPVLLTRRNGLLNNVIHSIIEDNMHNIWVSSSYGITCLQIVDNQVKYVTSFNESDNVPNETFIDGKVLKLEDGTICMQSLDHIVLFNPADFSGLLAQQPMRMHPKFTSMLVNGTYVTAGTEVNGSVILDKAITRTKEINLNYDQNTLSLTFSALNFARPLQTYYRVRIKELDDKWHTYSYYSSGGLVDRKGLLHLPLIGLRPGTYHLEVLASNVPDKWVGEPYEWIVNVYEPWWRSTALLAFLVLAVLALVGVNLYQFNHNTRLRAKRNSDEGDMVRRIMNFAERTEVYEKELISFGLEEREGSDLSPEFMKMMIVVLPYIKEKKGQFTIRELVDLTGSDIKEFYKVLSANLYKNPRSLTLVLRLQQVQEQLRTTNKSLEQISEECHFESPNGLISSFFHFFKMTPREYRLSI